MEFYYYMATAVDLITICSAFKLLKKYLIHSEIIFLLSSKGNKISGICDYPYHLNRNSLYRSPQQINMVMVYDVQLRLSSDQELFKTV